MVAIDRALSLPVLGRKLRHEPKKIVRQQPNNASYSCSCSYYSAIDNVSQSSLAERGHHQPALANTRSCLDTNQTTGSAVRTTVYQSPRRNRKTTKKRRKISLAERCHVSGCRRPVRVRVRRSDPLHLGEGVNAQPRADGLASVPVTDAVHHHDGLHKACHVSTRDE